MKKIEHPWELLKWDYVCDQSPDIQLAYEKANDSAEYGVNWYEFINNISHTPHFSTTADKWWNSLPHERQLELLKKELDDSINLPKLLRKAIKQVETPHTTEKKGSVSCPTCGKPCKIFTLPKKVKGWTYCNNPECNMTYFNPSKESHKSP